MRNGTAWCEPEITIIQRFVMAGDVVVDLGANRGWYTRFLSNVVGEKGLVLSVEPVHGTYAILEHVVRKRRLGNVRTFQCAVSDREDCVDMEIPPDTSRKANDYLARIALPGSSPQHGTVRVPAMTLDHLVTFGRKPVGFIKCDVEGYELASSAPQC